MSAHETPPDGGRDAYVREIMRREADDARAAAAERASPAARAGRRRAWLLVLLPLAAALTAWNGYRLTHRPEAAATAEERASARFTIYLIASELEAHRAGHGALPPDLATVGADDAGIDYRPTEAGYTLSAVVGDSTLIYRSGEPLDPYRDAYATLQREAGR